MKIGELTFLNITDTDRNQMMQNVHEKVSSQSTEDNPFYGVEQLEVVFFDNLNVTVQSTPNNAPTALPRKASTMASKEETT